jgi:hypothetical protein
MWKNKPIAQQLSLKHNPYQFYKDCLMESKKYSLNMEKVNIIILSTIEIRDLIPKLSDLVGN